MTFQELRDRISICEIAELLGYKLDRSAGKNHLSYYLGEQNSKTEEIIIYNPNNSSIQTYFNRKGSDKGNLINFVQARLDRFPSCDKSGMAGVNKVLHEYLGKSSSIETTKINNKVTDKDVFDKEYWKPHSISSKNKYLTQRRMISSETINTFASKGFVFEVGKSRHVGFPFRKPGNMEITNFEMRNFFEKDNKNYKGFCKGGDKSHSVWIANLVPYEKVEHVIFFESAIDAMSFYELYKLTPETPIALVSTGGNVTKSQIENIPKLFPENVQYQCCYDNDTMGKLFDVSTAFYLKGLDCKVFKTPGEAHVCTPDMNYTFPESKFDSRVFLSLQGINMKVKKVCDYKDWNEKLCSLKTKELNTSSEQEL